MFAFKNIDGVDEHLGTKVFDAIVTVAYASVMTAIILGVINRVLGLRVTKDAEIEDLDLEQHGEHIE